MFIKCQTHTIDIYLILYSDLEGLLNLIFKQLFHYYQDVYHQDVAHFMSNGNKKRLTMKKHLKSPCLLIEQAKLQFEAFNLQNELKLPPFELNKYYKHYLQLSPLVPGQNHLLA